MKVILLGSGGREAALAWKISQSPECEQLYIAPGNGGTAAFGTNVAINPSDFASIETFIRTNGVTLLVVGNEDPLVAGIRDYFAKALPELLIVGPAADGAALEGSKDFAKHFMMRHGIPTAAYRSFTAETVEQGCEFLASLKAPYVLKADGLAAGKGVLIINDLSDAQQSLREMLGGMFGQASATVVVEEFLDGIECSVFVLTDGTGEYRILPVAKDYKRIGEGDTGLNTGGMGAVSPVPFADDEFMKKVEERIVRPTVNGLIADKIDYRGFIFLGLIKVGEEPMVIEYNVRMGDPETEAVMLRVKSDLLPLLEATAKGSLGDMPLEIDPRTVVTVMAVSGGYPGSYPKGMTMTGLDKVCDSVLFHAGTAVNPDGSLVTAGGRVIAASSYGESIADAAARSFKAVQTIEYDGKYYRRDIGRDLIALL
ncbi:MAG: phosphoribosylamine--glycine ligase [Muribaculaceae bacterium]|nr:phosphoribosylamine--glycine ligase [Muribaculaceae bacterium]